MYIAIRSPHRAIDGNIPFTRFFGSKPDLSHLRTFGCAANVHIPKERRSGKFGPHRQLVTFVGYPHSQKAWKFFDTSTGKYIIGHEATFLELNRFETITMDLGTVNSSHRSETVEDETAAIAAGQNQSDESSTSSVGANQADDGLPSSDGPSLATQEEQD